MIVQLFDLLMIVNNQLTVSQQLKRICTGEQVSEVRALSAVLGESHALVVTDDGQLFTWGMPIKK
jgi:alpha-tubulin suppressor-like RCC1 family protein